MLAIMKMNVALVALVASLLTIAASRQLLQSGTARVTFFDNGNYSGGGQAFSTDVPATGCGGCENLVRFYSATALYVQALLHVPRSGNPPYPSLRLKYYMLSVWSAPHVHIGKHRRACMSI